MTAETTYRPISGWGPLLVTLAMFVAAPWLFVGAILGLDRYGTAEYGYQLAAAVLLLLLAVLSLFGYMAIAPNQARVLLLFGKYKGSVLSSGFFWVNPFFSKKKLSLRVRNFETGTLYT